MVFAEIAPAVAVRLAFEEPACTVTDAANGSSGVLLDSKTETPPAGEGLESVTVHVVVSPAFSSVGLHTMLLMLSGASNTMLDVRDVPL